MKIAVFLTYNYSLSTWKNSGTLERELLIYEELSNHNDVEFVFFSYGNDSDRVLLKNYKNFDVIPMYKNFKIKNKFIRFIFSLLIPIIFYRNIKNMDIIHQHQLLGSWVVLLAKLITKKPLLIRTGYDMYEFSILENVDYLRRSFLYFLTYFSLKFCNLYTVASKCDKEFLTNRFKKHSNKIVIRSNWIKEINIAKSSVNNYQVLSVGRLENQKNYLKLIYEFPENSKYSLKIIGDGSQKEAIKNIIDKNKLNVVIQNNIKNDSILEIMNKHKFYLSSSLFEGNPKTILEAMSVGSIVLASNIKNHQEIITNQVNGYIVNLNNLDIQNQLNKISSNPEMCKTIANNAKKYVLEKYNLIKIRELIFQDYLLLSK